MSNETAFLLFTLMFCAILVLVGFIAGTVYAAKILHKRSNKNG